MKLKKGDSIVVLTGKDKGKTGKIEKVYPKKNAVLISGINVYKRHVKRRDEKNPGGIVDISRPIDASKVALLDPRTKTATRIGYMVIKGEKKRIAKKGNKQI
ncbi:50S ribosomal protein L24 [Candidatus Roizmanbacteria bacterium]|nr:50S ribosomal protein L24 [Candidatus Roizmanbacteria bacterium]